MEHRSVCGFHRFRFRGHSPLFGFIKLNSLGMIVSSYAVLFRNDLSKLLILTFVVSGAALHCFAATTLY